MFNIIRVHGEEQFNETGATIIASLLQTNPKAILGLATGSTPIGVYNKLIELYQKGLLSFRNVTTYNLDEYVGLPKDHEQSYSQFMKKHLFYHIDIDPANTFIPDGNSGDADEAAAHYNSLLESSPVFDLQLLGIGHNGHIGFNEPGNELIGNTHVVSLHESTRVANARFFASLEDVPTQAITMGIGAILHAKQILLLVKGKDKLDALQRAIYGPITTQCPASFLQVHPHVLILTDAEAGAF